MSKLSLKANAKPLSELVAGLGVCAKDTLVTTMVDDTRLLQAGDTFLCLPRAQNVDALLQDAINKGAAAIIFVGFEQRDIALPAAFLADMAAAGRMLRRWFETEGSDIPCVGITGTDGKTSTTWMLREVLAQQLGSAWSCGTLGLIRSADDITDLGNTTPSLLTLHTLLGMAVHSGVGALVLEVSSHGIAQQRIAGVPFTAAIWTTIGQDHLEDHGGFESYLACKKQFIESVATAGGIVVANAKYDVIKSSLAAVSGRVFWYAQDDQADLLWSRDEALVFTDQREEVELMDVPLADFHAENLAAVALLVREHFGLPLSAFSRFDGLISTPMGRLEPVGEKQQVFIDYAHTAEGLRRCLESARALTARQLLLVFGCGGDRDKAKRPEMGAVAVKYADMCWLTSDNPRSEKQADIVADVLAGITVNQERVRICDDRQQAIKQAVCSLSKGDVLVIAGKGHESYMEINGQRLPWSDKAAALQATEEVPSCA